MDACGGACFVLLPMRRLGAFEAAVAHLRGPMRRGRPTRTHAPRIEFGGFDPPTFLVGFATAKRRGFELERSVRSEEHTSELKSLMGNSVAVFCLKKKSKSTNSSVYKLRTDTM